MRFEQVDIAALGYALPEEVVTSTEIEARLKPVYERLRLPEGRLELMTGIRERRLWPAGFRPSDAAALAGRDALRRAALAPEAVDALFHCSVCRDFLEPATSTVVHHQLGLGGHALNFDLSNACLGVLSGMIVAAGMIELGQLRSALIVSGENSRPLFEATLRRLLEDRTLTRQSSKDAFASLTIGSAAAAALLVRRDPARPGHRLLGGACRANTAWNHLCQGDAAGNGGALMSTNSEELLVRGVETAAATWADFKRELGWNETTPDIVCTHQVGRVHRDRLYQALGLDPARDFATVDSLGNCGSASLPVTAARAADSGRLQPGQRLAMLGIGSGINCAMLGVDW
ncbi:MAG: 3-oxoacyl-ACP synthase III [Lentisphaeria bacterium]